MLDKSFKSQKDNALTPEEWAQAVLIGIAAGVALHPEGKSELRQACKSKEFRDQFLEQLLLIGGEEVMRGLGFKGKTKEIPSSWYLD